MVFTYYQEYWVKFFKCKNLLVLKLAPFLHSAFTQYSSYFQALIFQNLCNSKKVKHFSGMFAARQHAYLSPLKLNLCSNGKDHGTRHIQSCLLLHSPTNASMHGRCIRRYLKFCGLCLSPCFLGEKNLSNGQFMIQGQIQILSHSSLINNFKNIIKVRNFPVRKLS